MKFRTFIVPLAVVASLVLVLGLGLLGSFALRTPLYLVERGGQSIPEALRFVPKQAPVVASVLARPDRLAQLWEYLATPKLRQGIRADRSQIERFLLAQTGLVYARDIQPWLGEEITAALVSRDLDQDPTNGMTPGYLVALSCRDGQTARSTLELFWQNRALAGEALTFEDMGGSRLIYARRWELGDPPQDWSPAAWGQFATALVANRFVLVANHPQVLRQAITAAQAGDGNLGADPRYKVAIKALPNQRVGLLAVNLSEAGHWLRGEGVETDGLALDHLGTSQERVDWGLMSLGVTRQGILADAAWLAPRGQSLQPRSHRLTDWYSLASYLPDPLTLAALGVSLGDLRQQLQPFLRLWGNHALPIQFLDQPLETLLGTAATKLLVEGADQPYALGLSQASPTLRPSWLLVSAASPTFDHTLAELDHRARQQGLGVGQLDILGYPTTVWTRLSLPQRLSKGSSAAQVPGTKPQSNQPLQVKTEVAGLAAQVGGYQVLTTAPEAMEQVLLVDQRQETPPDWTEQLRWFTHPSEGYLHLDWPRAEAELRQQIPQFRLWETVANPILRHLRQITLASYGQTEQMQTMGLFLQLSNQ